MKQGMRQERDMEGQMARGNRNNRRPASAIGSDAVEVPLFPMRLNKYLAWKRQSSRRDMDKIIEEGRVIVNGSVAVLGTKVNEGDHVDVRFHGNKERAIGSEHAAKRRGKAQKGKR